MRISVANQSRLKALPRALHVKNELGVWILDG